MNVLSIDNVTGLQLTIHNYTTKTKSRSILCLLRLKIEFKNVFLGSKIY